MECDYSSIALKCYKHTHQRCLPLFCGATWGFPKLYKISQLYHNPEDSRTPELQNSACDARLVWYASMYATHTGTALWVSEWLQGRATVATSAPVRELCDRSGAVFS